VFAPTGHLHFAFLKTSDHRNGQLYRCNSLNPSLGITVGGSDSLLDVNSGKLMTVGRHCYCRAQWHSG